MNKNSDNKERRILFEGSAGGGGWWAYLQNLPTTRTWGETKAEAFANLMLLLDDVED